MKIAVVGAGRVGTALGGRWAALGHDVTYGVRNPTAEKDLPGKVATVADAVRGAELVALTTPWEAVADAVAAMGDVRGKIIIDATNPLVMGKGGLVIDPKLTGSAAEFVAARAAGARVVKAFNQTSFENMAHPDRLAQRPVMLVAGDDTEAKKIVLDLVAQSGFEAMDAGPLVHAVHLEHLAFIWVDLAFKRGLPRNVAFALTRARA